MKTYTEFHGGIEVKNIGKRLREICKKEKMFKIMTGYGSSSGVSLSKNSAIKSLSKMKKEGIIKGFFPGEVKNILLDEKSIYYEDKLIFSNHVKNDNDYGNDGIIFVFVK